MKIRQKNIVLYFCFFGKKKKEKLIYYMNRYEYPKLLGASFFVSI